MIEKLRISNLGVIKEAELDLGAGLTALTGETGAGKTMAVTSLQLLLGAKADSTKVRRGAEGAQVEGIFTVPLGSEVLDRISESGGVYDIDDDVAVVVISRHVPVSGRSRSFIGGRTVPTSVLAQIAGDLVTVHGQSDQIRLATSSQQARALDAFGGEPIAQALAVWQQTLAQLNAAEAALALFDSNARSAARERLALEALISKVDAVAPELGEDEALKAEARLLENSESLYLALSDAAAQLSGSDSVEVSAVGSVEAAARALEEFIDDSELSELHERLDAARIELSDISGELADRAAHTEANPERLATIYARRQELAGLRKDLAMDLDQILEEAGRARSELEDLADPVGTREKLASALAQASQASSVAGRKLHSLRVSAAKELSRFVSEELPSLALPDATFGIDVTGGANPSANGTDNVAFLLASHKGAPQAPLGQGASGGELSRIMLAVEVSLARRNNETGHTFLFDEVDSGVGGRAALSVGKRLADLASSCQVLVVTHLAQVAAYASTQAVVVKETGGEAAVTEVVPVDGDSRLAELARMLSGTDSQTARAHAAELLASVDMAR